jgi:hypothetical protein
MPKSTTHDKSRAYQQSMAYLLRVILREAFVSFSIGDSLANIVAQVRSSWQMRASYNTPALHQCSAVRPAGQTRSTAAGSVRLSAKRLPVIRLSLVPLSMIHVASGQLQSPNMAACTLDWRAGHLGQQNNMGHMIVSQHAVCTVFPDISPGPHSGAISAGALKLRETTKDGTGAGSLSTCCSSAAFSSSSRLLGASP